MTTGLELTFTLGDLITAAAFIATGLIAAGGLKGKLKSHDLALDDIKTELKALSAGMLDLVRFSGRLDRMDDRAIMQGARIDAAQGEVSKLRDDFTDLMRELNGKTRSGQNTRS